MAGATYWRARPVEEVAEKLIAEHHDHLSGVPIRYLFREPTAKSKGRLVFGKARKVGGLNAHLVALAVDEELGDDPPDFFVVEIAAQVWEALNEQQRVALVDHELCHFDVEEPEDVDEDRKLRIVGHDLEEFTEVVQRHGLWRDSVEAFAKAAAGAQLEFDLDGENDGDDEVADGG